MHLSDGVQHNRRLTPDVGGKYRARHVPRHGTARPRHLRPARDDIAPSTKRRHSIVRYVIVRTRLISLRVLPRPLADCVNDYRLVRTFGEVVSSVLCNSPVDAETCLSALSSFGRVLFRRFFIVIDCDHDRQLIAATISIQRSLCTVRTAFSRRVVSFCRLHIGPDFYHN